MTARAHASASSGCSCAPDREPRDHEPLGVAAIKLARGERSAACQQCPCCQDGNTSARCWSSPTDGLHPTKAQHVVHTARPCCSLQKEAALRVVSAETSLSDSRSGPCSCRSKGRCAFYCMRKLAACCAAAARCVSSSRVVHTPLSTRKHQQQMPTTQHLRTESHSSSSPRVGVTRVKT